MYNQEHGGQTIVRYFPEIDPESERSDIGISTIEWNTIPWMRVTLLHDRAVKLSKGKVHVYSDSVLCPGNEFMNIPNQQKPGSKRLSDSRNVLDIVNWRHVVRGNRQASPTVEVRQGNRLGW